VKAVPRRTRSGAGRRLWEESERIAERLAIRRAG
jgi:hypothetical protein